MERPHEIREIGEADIEGDVGHRAIAVGKEPRRAAKARAHQVLMWGHADDLREEPQEVEGAEPDLVRRPLEVDRLVRMDVEVKGSLDRAAAIATGGRRRLPFSAGNELEE